MRSPLLSLFLGMTALLVSTPAGAAEPTPPADSARALPAATPGTDPAPPDETTSPSAETPAPAAAAASAAAAEDAPLPEARELLARLIANQDQVDALRASYTYKVREIEYENKGKDGARDYRKKEEAVYQVYPSRKLFIRRLLERDGKPLDEKETKKEDERIEKQTREYEKRERERAARAARATAAGGPPPGDDEDDDGKGVTIRLQDLLRASRLRTLAREPFDGRTCLIIEVVGNDDYKARTRAEKFVKELSGRVWVDEADLQIARAEASLDKIRIGGGLVATLQDARFVFEQRRVNDEVWLPTLADVEFHARVLLFKKLDGRETAEFYEYERYGTDVGIDFGAPAAEAPGATPPGAPVASPPEAAEAPPPPAP